MKTILKLLLAAFVLSIVPTTYICAQGHIETPAERKARQEREAAAKRKRQQQTTWGPQQILAELEKNMVRVEGGTFMMGSDKSKWRGPVHEVTLSTFYLCKYEVTQELWQAVMGSNPSAVKGAKQPVEMVSWDDCQQFVAKLNDLTDKHYRLPTEAEWEYAARGGNRSKGYVYAGSNDANAVSWHYGISGNDHHNVGTKRPNELGVYDMSGNVSEWCSDWYGADYYSVSPSTNPTGPVSGTEHVLRGGSCCNHESFSEVTARRHYGYSSRDVGLRLALSE